MTGPRDERDDDERLSPAELDALRRARMRRRILGGLEPRAPRLSDRFYGGLVLLGRPAPVLVRAGAVLLILASVVVATGVAAADSLPDEPLYGVKLATEQARLAFAATPEDRATVELSIAEHRLTEAVLLAEEGREDDALEASSAYGTHLAAAAAELATVEPGLRADALVGQLETRLATQRRQVAAAATRLAADPRTAPAAAVLATVTATAPPVEGASAAARIAANAAAFSERAAVVAEERWRNAAPPSASPHPPTDGASPRPGAPGATASATRPNASARSPFGALPTPDPTASPRASPRASQRAAPTVDPVAAKVAAERARKAAEGAHRAAERATHTATPGPRRTGGPIVAPRSLPTRD